MDLIVKFSLAIAALTLIGCGSSEIRGERLDQLDIVDSESWTEINVVFQQPDRFTGGLCCPPTVGHNTPFAHSPHRTRTLPTNYSPLAR